MKHITYFTNNIFDITDSVHSHKQFQ